MINENNRLQEAKAKTLEISQQLIEFHSFIKSSKEITPLMRHTLEGKFDEILAKIVQLLRITKSK